MDCGAACFSVCRVQRARLLLNNQLFNNPAVVWFGFGLGILLGMTIGKLEMNVVLGLVETVTMLRAERLLIKCFDELQSLRAETSDDCANENET